MERLYPQGLCESCFWRYECYYAVDNVNEYVRNCDDDGGLSYQYDKGSETDPNSHISDKINVDAYINRENGSYRIFAKRAKYKHWFELGKHRETDIAFERALQSGQINWKPKIVDKTKIF